MTTFISADLQRYNLLVAEIDAIYHQASSKLGFSDSAMQVLYTICTTGGDRCPLCDIVRLTGVSKQTINSALRKLEAEGIVRLDAADGKKKTVCLTEKGIQTAKISAMKIIAIENEIFAEWTAQERETYLALTQKYLINMRGKIKDL